MYGMAKPCLQGSVLNRRGALEEERASVWCSGWETATHEPVGCCEGCKFKAGANPAGHCSLTKSQSCFVLKASQPPCRMHLRRAPLLLNACFGDNKNKNKNKKSQWQELQCISSTHAIPKSKLKSAGEVVRSKT